MKKLNHNTIIALIFSASLIIGVLIKAAVGII